MTHLYWAEGAFYVQFGYRNDRLKATPWGEGFAWITLQRPIGRGGVMCDVKDYGILPWSGGRGPVWR